MNCTTADPGGVTGNTGELVPGTADQKPATAGVVLLVQATVAPVKGVPTEKTPTEKRARHADHAMVFGGVVRKARKERLANDGPRNRTVDRPRTRSE